MGRGGQVFYLYNRVETIEQKVEEIQELVPEARIGYAHGQMTEAQLENTLLNLLKVNMMFLSLQPSLKQE